MASRLYTSRRQAIVNSIVAKLKEIDGSGEFLNNLFENVEPRFLFWDQVNDFPALHVNAGGETRDYQGGGYKDRFLNVTIRIYVREENAADALESIIEDVETVLEDNAQMTYTDKQGNSQRIHQITIVSIDTDEGVLEPDGVGEIILEVRY